MKSFFRAFFRGELSSEEIQIDGSSSDRVRTISSYKDVGRVAPDAEQFPRCIVEHDLWPLYGVMLQDRANGGEVLCFEKADNLEIVSFVGFSEIRYFSDARFAPFSPEVENEVFALEIAHSHPTSVDVDELQIPEARVELVVFFDHAGCDLGS